MKRQTAERKKAVALSYDAEKDIAPRVTAKGEGLVAEKILEIARASGVPVRQDSDLVEVLSRLELNAAIPPDTYAVVAEILAWIYKVNNKAINNK
ncbi:MAG: EscU/YscU/HrcU family type III secretion system export apparatus switch protein [Dissulfurimicrobium sp.]|uniref:EscU/YscU/HrcU family type III secretion system export apparatus switch protein n=1 Tax=Dissulfurimicrobium TaxID=1769732 RepID=UPI001EDC2958|nr:EscU/YscU/HrcU family type III secretion system export apparatus switch protein [Dissulfurimicrobium hydrothermale]UKL13718.1 EscU/YscU/HrcU family type III secretion system export apparatus switch protein [Dissulfurimicrobium hydrothermale]